MILSKKQYAGCPDYDESKKLFATVSGQNMRFSTHMNAVLGANDYVYIDILSDREFLLIPTNNPSGHKITTYRRNNATQLSISAAGLCRTIPVPKRTRIYCELQKDGSLLFKINSEGGGTGGTP